MNIEKDTILAGVVIAVCESEIALRELRDWESRGDNYLYLDVTNYSDDDFLELSEMFERLSFNPRGTLMIGFTKSSYVQTFSIPERYIRMAGKFGLGIEVSVYEAE